MAKGFVHVRVSEQEKRRTPGRGKKELAFEDHTLAKTPPRKHQQERSGWTDRTYLSLCEKGKRKGP